MNATEILFEQFVDDEETQLDEQSTMVKYSKFFSAVALSVCVLLGFYGNVMSTLIFLRSEMRSPINDLLAAVSIIDLILLLLIVPILILPSLNLYLEDLFLEHCYRTTILYLYPLGMMSQTASMWTYVLIGVERYVAVCQPLKSYKLLTNRQAKRAQCVIVLVAVLYNVIRFWEYNFDPEVQDLVPFLRANRFYFLFYFTTLHLITHFLLPISIILVLHSSIILNLKHARDDRSSMRTSNGSWSNDRLQKSTTFMILIATGTFVACHVAPFLISLWETIDRSVFKDGRWSTFLDVLTDLANLLLAVHSACSFLIYMKFCRQYRQIFCRLMRLSSRSDRSERRNRRKAVPRSVTDAENIALNCASPNSRNASFRPRVASDLAYLESSPNSCKTTHSRSSEQVFY